MNITNDTPLVPPPPGEVSDFDISNPRGTALVVIAYVSVIFALIFLALRLYSRLFVTHSFGWDDATCILAWITTAISCFISITAADYGLGKHAWDIRLLKYLESENAKALFVSKLSYIISMGLIKISLLIMFFRLFDIKAKLRKLIIGTIVLTVLTHLAMVFIFLFRCTPFEAKWVTIPIDPNVKCKNIFPGWISLAIVTILFDIIIVGIPIRIVPKLQMRKAQRIIIGGLLSVGVLVTIVSIARLGVLCYAYLGDEKKDLTRVAFLYFLLSIFEMNVAIICASVPPVKAVVTRYTPYFISSNQNSNPSAMQELYKYPSPTRKNMLGAHSNEGEESIVELVEQTKPAGLHS